MFAGVGYALSGSPKQKSQGPPINATSKDEENFIQYVARYRNETKQELASGPCRGADEGIVWALAHLRLTRCRDFLKQADSEEKKAKH